VTFKISVITPDKELKHFNVWSAFLCYPFYTIIYRSYKLSEMVHFYFVQPGMYYTCITQVSGV